MEGDITYSPARGEVFRHIKINKRYHTGPYIALYHATREQGTAEEGVGRANWNKHEKTTVLRLR